MKKTMNKGLLLAATIAFVIASSSLSAADRGLSIQRESTPQSVKPSPRQAEAQIPFTKFSCVYYPSVSIIAPPLGDGIAHYSAKLKVTNQGTSKTFTFWVKLNGNSCSLPPDMFMNQFPLIQGKSMTLSLDCGSSKNDDDRSRRIHTTSGEVIADNGVRFTCGSSISERVPR